MDKCEVEVTGYDAMLDKLADSWPSAIVSRRSFKEFSGGLYGSKFLANLDCAGLGIEGGFTIGGQKVYPVASAIAWLKNRASKSWADRKTV